MDISSSLDRNSYIAPMKTIIIHVNPFNGGITAYKNLKALCDHNPGISYKTLQYQLSTNGVYHKQGVLIKKVEIINTVKQ